MKVELYGELISDEWDWLYSLFDIQHFCPGNVREAIEGLPDGEDLILEINSPGGDAFAGFEIYGLVQSCRAHTEAHIVALAASAATTVCSACETVLASPVAQIMIHQPALYVGDVVNNEAARQIKNLLDSIKASIINGYVIKSGGKATRRTFEKLVDQSTYMPVQDAIELGLVDGLLDAEDEVLESLSAGVVVKNAAGCDLFTPRALLERYEKAVRAGEMEEVAEYPVRTSPSAAPTPPLSGEARTADWKLAAAIAIERARVVL